MRRKNIDRGVDGVESQKASSKPERSEPDQRLDRASVIVVGTLLQSKLLLFNALFTRHSRSQPALLGLNLVAHRKSIPDFLSRCLPNRHARYG
ncbi:hypothetical protein PoB_000877300 [Plakobranchus ocellatus]|uniref:Uncharacterized protein n=1 Tax=Plakobranchus ocellatus TaxID=259542 RepID=A0AAV3YJ75_9GAST|nr:hypothetical protein PoB_000877300 [Plakobranchus ocellatus]